MLEQAGINIKGLNVDKLKAEYQELMKQKSELTSTYKDCANVNICLVVYY